MINGSARRSTALSLLGAIVLSAQLGAQTTRPIPRVDVYEASITELQAAMTRGDLTSVALVDAYLARIAAYDSKGPELNSMIRLNPRARADAASLDHERRAGKVRGVLHGIPVILKDNFDTADIPTTGGLLALANLQPSRDASVVRRLREAGAIVLGKSNLHELAHGITTVSSLGGQTRNPYDPTRNPGGSSGGTGAAVAASFAAVGWGSDTCGSIRIPCAFNSLFGLRPTQGMVSRDGMIPLSHTQDIAGPLARTVKDLAIALDVTVGADPADSTTRVLEGRMIPRFVDSLSATALRGARLGILRNYFADTDEEIADSIRSAIGAMKALGAEVIDVTVPGFDSLVAGTAVIVYEMKFDFNDYLAQHPGAPVSSLSEVLQRGLFHEALEPRFRLRDTMKVRDSEPYKRALTKRGALRTRMVGILDSLGLDALLYPTMRQRPAIIGDPQVGSTCALSAQSGLPALSAPVGFLGDGLPVGIEMLGRPFGDARLVALAYSFEQSGPRRRPPSTTPPLANGVAPKPVGYSATARAAAAAAARAHFTFNPLRNELAYELRVSGVAPERVSAVVLRKVDSARAGRVIQRLSGPGTTHATGKVVLSGSDRRALTDGRIALALITSDRRSADGDARLEIHRAP